MKPKPNLKYNLKLLNTENKNTQLIKQINKETKIVVIYFEIYII